MWKRSAINQASTEVEWAWAAGLFEGEGCLHVNQHIARGTRAYLAMYISSTDEDVLRRFHSIVGVGTINGPRKNKTGNGNPDNWKPFWKWNTCGAAALDLVAVEAFTAHLCVRRRARLDEIFAILAAQKPPTKDPSATHCSHGHEYTQENTYRHTNNQGYNTRRCRACMNEQSRRSRQRRRERLAAA